MSISGIQSGTEAVTLPRVQLEQAASIIFLITQLSCHPPPRTGMPRPHPHAKGIGLLSHLELPLRIPLSEGEGIISDSGNYAPFLRHGIGHICIHGTQAGISQQISRKAEFLSCGRQACQ